MICTKCKIDQDKEEFYPNKAYRRGRTTWCRACQAKYHARESVKEKKRKYKQKLKKEVMDAYGGKCNCCEETTLVFLTIDHIHNDGHEHRRKLGVGGGTAFYCWLRKNNYPKGFQVLCFNCNCGRSINGGICPHKVKGKKWLIKI